MKYQEILKNEEINTYIKKADENLKSMGYTEHSFAHASKCAKTVKYILETLEYSEHQINLAQIAAHMHDIGNMINRKEHAQLGATIAYNILSKLNFGYQDIAEIISAIGNHDETSAYAVSPISAALIIADKTDVRRSRVRIEDMNENDIHDRVNYSVEKSELYIDKKERTISLQLTIDTDITSVMDYFEIFLTRMNLCKNAAKVLNLKFKLYINGLIML